MAPVLSITVHALWDDEAGVWVATSDDIDGLAIEADTFEALEPKVKGALADLIELNGVISPLKEIPFSIIAQQTSHLQNPHAA